MGRNGRTDIHGHKHKIESKLRWLRGEPKPTSDVGETRGHHISPCDLPMENRAHIIDFYNNCTSEGLGIERTLHYLQILPRLASMLSKDFADADEKDIKAICSTIETSDYAESTKHDYKVTLKKFYRWLRGSDEYPPEVKWIKCTIKNGNHKLPEEVLTEDDIKAMIKATPYARDKALVMTLYESGCRVSELLTVLRKNVSFDEYGAVMRVTGKTGDRRVRLVASAPLLAEWYAKHPEPENPDAPLWVNRVGAKKGEQMMYSPVRMLLIRLAKTAGVRKAVNPHMFRHSRATALAGKGYLNDAQMKEFFGWTQGSNMATIYVHMSGRDIDDAILNSYGLKGSEKEEKKEALAPKECARCHEVHDATSQFCNRCGMALSLEVAMEKDAKRELLDELLHEALKQSDVQDALEAAFRKLGLGERLRGGGVKMGGNDTEKEE